MKEKVVVGLSGGVDSSFAAAILKEQGYDVIGVMLKLWSVPEQEEMNRCCSLDAMVLAKRVAAILDIPFYAIDARETFRQTVVEYFIHGYSHGITPNPCVLCNTQVRWKVLLEQADKMGAVKVATGHYARIDQTQDGFLLKRGLDLSKDQSYVLSMLPSEYISKTFLPVGDYYKKVVREKCRSWGLPTAGRPDSQDLCFLGNMDYRDFLSKYAMIQNEPGKIIDSSGKTLGEHQGLHQFTIGQRQGLRISYPYPLYVIQKDMQNNVLVVGEKSQLERRKIQVKDINWLGDPQGKELDDIQIKVRYSSPAISGSVTLNNPDILEVILNEPVTQISPGQIAAIYSGEVCLGGGIIV